MRAHVFIDNSNVFHGAQREAKRREPDAPWPAVRISYPRLFTLVEATHTVITRTLAGSVPPGNDDLWSHARRGGYNTDLLRRVASSDGSSREQGVDEMLHLKIANALLDYDAPQALVLVTGDGAKSDFGTSFIRQAERAVKRSWTLHVWSWRRQLSPKFAQLTRPAKPVHLNYFDGNYADLVYLKRGRYRLDDVSVYCPGRAAGAAP
jgi:hypothetical protein